MHHCCNRRRRCHCHRRRCRCRLGCRRRCRRRGRYRRRCRRRRGRYRVAAAQLEVWNGNLCNLFSQKICNFIVARR